VAGELGAQNSLVGGGRYDGLIKTLGGPDLPAMGFGAGIERIIQTLLKQEGPRPNPGYPLLFLIPIGQASAEVCFRILHELRQSGIPAQMDYSGKKLAKAMQYADAIKAKYVAVVGDNELETDEVDLKEMATGHKTKAPLSSLREHLKI
jgi:histidyl-tRNA synthetase